VRLFGSNPTTGEDADNLFLQQGEAADKKGIQEIEDRKLPWYLLHPRSGFRFVWNILVISLLTYTATVMPFRFAFADTESFDWVVVEWVLNSLFFSDILVTCFSSYYDEEGQLITSLKQVLVTYVKTWMLLDIAGCLPLDTMMQSSANYSSLLRLARLPRLYRLTRLGRLLKIWKSGKGADCLEKTQDFLSIKHSATKMLSFFCTVCVCVHIMACLWIFTAKLEDDPESWLISKGFQDGSVQSLYIAAVYWAFTTLSTVGYGDISANTSIERVVAVMWMICGVYFFSFTIGSLSSILSSVDTKETLLTTKLAIIDEFVREARLSSSIRSRLRASVKYNSEKEGYCIADKQEMFYSLPKNLRYDIALTMHQGAVKEMQYFMEKEHAFVAMIVPFLRHLFVQSMSMVYSTGDYADEVYFISKGWCGIVYGAENYLVKKLQRGSYFGEIEVIEGVTRKYSVMSAADADLLVMNKKLLATVQQEFPRVYEEMVDVAAMRDKLNDKTITEHKELLRMKKDSKFSDMRLSEIKKSVAQRAVKKIEKRNSMLISKEPSSATVRLSDSSIDLQRQVTESETRMSAIEHQLDAILRLVSEQREMVQGLLRKRTGRVV
jgi:hyperpolarization activated cyclic nucleotide-gated potassium channel 1